jgi:hypothetical protein
MDPAVTISIIAILIVAVIAWKELGGKRDAEPERSEPRE